MVSALRRYLYSKRSDNFKLYLQTLKDMLLNFVASKYHLYTKFIRVCFQSMHDLSSSDQKMYKELKDGFVVIQQSDMTPAQLTKEI